MISFPQLSMASRVSASFATSSGFGEDMVAHSWKEYKEKAVELSKRKDKYKVIRMM